MICVGVDPGYANFGVAAVERVGNVLTLLHWAHVETKPKNTDEVRERAIWDSLATPIRKYHPAVLGMENQLQVNVASRMRAQKGKGEGKSTGGFNANNDHVTEVVGLTKGCCLAYGVRRALFQPSQIKSAVCGTSKGVDKKQMIEAVRRLFPVQLGAGVRLSEHEADAIAAAVLACRVEAIGMVTR